MTGKRDGQIAVIFTAQRTAEDEAGYHLAAKEMAMLAAAQPGYCGMVSVRGADGLGITISYWADEAAALGWRDNPDHCAAREAGRNRWYAAYTIDVAPIRRSYDWSRHD
jgi:heme-degrading monooxygenase HmoA